MLLLLVPTISPMLPEAEAAPLLEVYDGTTVTFDFMFGDARTSGGHDGSGLGQMLDGPSSGGLVVDNSGNIYISDQYSHRVIKFDSSGNFLMEIGPSTSTTNECYASSELGNSVRGDELKKSLMCGPLGLAVDSSNSLYVWSAWNSIYAPNTQDQGCLHKFSSSGNLLWSKCAFEDFPTLSVGSANIVLSSDVQLEVDSSNNIYLADRYNNRIVKLDSSGNLLTVLGTGVQGSGPGQFNSVYGVAVDNNDGSIYATDGMNNRVQKFDSSGNYISEVSAYANPYDVDVDEEGNVYITATNGNGASTHQVRIYSDFENNVLAAKIGSGQSSCHVFQGCTSLQGGDFIQPKAIDVKNGKMYVGDSNRKIQVFNVNVPLPDTTPPVVLNHPSGQDMYDIVTYEATDASGMIIPESQFPVLTATDDVDGSLSVTCTPSSTTLFPVGTTLVTCTATDAAGNTGSRILTVTIAYTQTDTTPPIVGFRIFASDHPDNIAGNGNLTPGQTLVLTAPDSSGYRLDWYLQPSDDVDGSAAQGQGNWTSGLGGQTANHSCWIGAGPAAFTIPHSNPDNGNGSDDYGTYGYSSHYEGYNYYYKFPVGDTQVNCSASDAAGNQANLPSPTFTVTVVGPTSADTTPPTVNVPNDLTFIASDCWEPNPNEWQCQRGGLSLSDWQTSGGTFPPTATDDVDGSIVPSCTNYSDPNVSPYNQYGSYEWNTIAGMWTAPGNGGMASMLLGIHTFTCTATDAAGNVGTASFTVTVADTSNFNTIHNYFDSDRPSCIGFENAPAGTQSVVLLHNTSGVFVEYNGASIRAFNHLPTTYDTSWMEEVGMTPGSCLQEGENFVSPGEYKVAAYDLSQNLIGYSTPIVLDQWFSSDYPWYMNGPTLIVPDGITQATTDPAGATVSFTATLSADQPVLSMHSTNLFCNDPGISNFSISHPIHTSTLQTVEVSGVFPVGTTTVYCNGYGLGGINANRNFGGPDNPFKNPYDEFPTFDVNVVLTDDADVTTCNPNTGCNLSSYQTTTDITNPNFMQPAIAMSGNDITVVWQINVGGSDPVYFAKSHDGGLTFSAPEYLNHFSTGHHPDEVWSWFDNSGNNTEGLEFINYSYPSMGNSNNITLQSGGNSYKVWHENITEYPDNYEVFLSKNNSTPINLSNNPTDSVAAVVAVDGNNVYVGWKDYSSGDTKAYAVRSTDGGISFEQPIIVDSITDLGMMMGNKGNISIEASNGNAYAVWLNNDIIFEKLNFDSTADMTTPIVTVPHAVHLWGEAGTSQIVTFDVSATDNVGVVSGPTCTIESGSTITLQNGTSRNVTCSATDAAGNTGYANFGIYTDDGFDFTLPSECPDDFRQWSGSNATPMSTDVSGSEVTSSITMGWSGLGDMTSKFVYQKNGQTVRVVDVPAPTNNSPTFTDTTTLSQGEYTVFSCLYSNYTGTMSGGDGGTWNNEPVTRFAESETFVIGETVDSSILQIDNAQGSSSPGCEPNCFISSYGNFMMDSGQVIFKNTDNAAHTMTSGTPTYGPSGHFDTGTIMPGGSYTHALSEIGAYEFFCMIHPWMTGTIWVGTGAESIVILTSPADDIPPTITANNITQSATNSVGTVVSYNVTASDNSGVAPSVTCTHESGSFFQTGTTPVTCTARDEANNTTTAEFTVTVNYTALADTEPPTLSIPDDVSKTISIGQGTIVTYSTPTATDNYGVTSGPTCTPESGTTFPVGDTIVTCTAADAEGNTTTDTFTITVIKQGEGDVTPPTFQIVSGDIEIDATTANGAIVGYPIPGVTDNVGVTSGPTCTPESGSFFPVGKTTVTCIASDAAGNQGSTVFIVNVKSQIAVPETVQTSVSIAATKATYSSNEVISATGNVSPVTDDQLIFRITDSQDNVIAIEQKTPTQIGTYTVSFTPNMLWSTTGTYEITALYGTSEENTSFYFELLEEEEVIQQPVDVADNPTNLDVFLTDLQENQLFSAEIGDTIQIDAKLYRSHLGTVEPKSNETVFLSVENETSQVLLQSLNTDFGGNVGIKFTLQESFAPGVYTVNARSLGNGWEMNSAPLTFTVTKPVAQVSVSEVLSTTDQGETVSTYDAGNLAYFNTKISSNANTPVLVTINVFDAQNNTLGVGFFKSTIGAGESEIVLGFELPKDTASGVASVYTNVFTDWPDRGGVLITDEVQASVNIIGIEPDPVVVVAPEPEPIPAQSNLTVSQETGNTLTASIQPGPQPPQSETDPVGMANVRVVDAFGNSLDEVPVDQQVQIEVDLVNNSEDRETEQSFTYWIEGVSVSAGQYHHESWITGSMTGGQSISPALSWTPECGGDWSFIIHIVENMDNKVRLGNQLGLEVYVKGDECSKPEPVSISSMGQVVVENAQGSSTPGCEPDCFMPSIASIKEGGTVIFRNSDTAAHTSTSGTPSDGPTGVWDSSLMMVGSSYSVKLDESGTYPYFCMVHPWMTGLVVVGDSVLIDKIPPILDIPARIFETIDAQTSRSMIVTWNSSAVDNVDGKMSSGDVQCTPGSGSYFPIGRTNVTCTATDSSGNKTSDSFDVVISHKDLTDGHTDSMNTVVDNALGSSTPGCEPNCFIPSIASIKEGGTVIFRNSDTAAHTSTSGTPSDGPTGVWDSSLVMSGGSFTTPELEVGEYPYFCMVHPWMTGLVVVNQTGQEINDTAGPEFIPKPESIHIQSNNPLGSIVDYQTPLVTDESLILENPTCTPVSGTLFPIGKTTVTCSSTDVVGNTSTLTFTVTVDDSPADEIAPTLIVPSSLTYKMGSSDVREGLIGSAQAYGKTKQLNFDVSAIDNSGYTTIPKCNPPSGTFFPIGTTTVTCSVSDAIGNTSSSSFDVYILAYDDNSDKTPPTITALNDITKYVGNGSLGGFVTYPIPNVYDNVGVTFGPQCVPRSGSMFMVGTTQIICIASDDAGNTSSSNFNIIIKMLGEDKTSPSFSETSNIIKTTTNQTGLIIQYATPMATDQSPLDGTVTCNPPSGSLFPIGNTVVGCKVSDLAGNIGVTAFSVIVILDYEVDN